jgi:hypothetical protein
MNKKRFAKIEKILEKDTPQTINLVLLHNSEERFLDLSEILINSQEKTNYLIYLEYSLEENKYVYRTYKQDK